MRSHTPKGRLARDHIVSASERLFAAHGFHGTSLRDIAEAAAVPLATVIYHFEKKEQLYAAVLAEIASGLEQDLAPALAPPANASPEGYVAFGVYVARLDAAVAALVGWAERRPGRVRLLLRELLDNPTRVARATRLPLAPVLRNLTAFIEEGTRAGVFRAEPAETQVLHLVGAVSYFVVARPTVRRIVGPSRERRLADDYRRDAVLFARRALGIPDTHVAKEAPDGPNDRARPRAARARASRRRNDGQRRVADGNPDERLRR